ncbi:iron reductase domain protein [Xylariaceae sp. AK1471]|nr:iron reductase domain protein [Xylariaceae sp. AK1471]
MRTTHMRQLALASLAALPLATRAVSSSIFVSPQKDLAFALNVPDDASSSDLFFSIAFPVHTSWVAVGLGASTMKANPLVLMAYPSASGKNVTISPRRCYTHSEPVYDSEIDVQALPGTGLFNDTTYIFNGVCSNCRSWPSKGKIDISSTAQDMAYGIGPSGDTRSNDPQESVKVHWNYGSFTMDLVHATGAGGVPEIPASENVTSVGVVQQLAKTGHVDTRAILHAVFMILAFVGMWPFGILVLRVGGSVRWHAINQGAAFGVVLIGAILGFVMSPSYNRSKKFNTAHQIIGIFVFIFAIAQFALGYLHHRIYKKTQQTTKMAPIHVWLGRVIIPLGIANGFTGFPLALSPGYDFALLGVVAFVLPAFLLILLVKKVFKKFMQKTKQTELNGYDMEPWQGAQPGVQPGEQPPPGYTGRDPATPSLGPPPQGSRQFV